MMLLGWLCLYILSRSGDDLIKALCIAFVSWRIIDIVATALRVSLFDEFESKHTVHVSSAPSRVVVLAALNYIELCVCFAGLYAFNIGYIQSGSCKHQWVISETIEKALHFSWVTQTTVGYGEFYPQGINRIIASIQGMSGIIIIVVLIARWMSMMPNKVGCGTIGGGQAGGGQAGGGQAGGGQAGGGQAGGGQAGGGQAGGGQAGGGQAGGGQAGGGQAGGGQAGGGQAGGGS
ncbi:MAG: two pore domain potassium channel family protein [Phycisphaeraceae bacterium]|nr:two pore domain potassium channel family protein [Phycisphaeraceae bacterium]